MFRNKKTLYNIIKWLIMLLAYGYLFFKLADIRYWKELKISFETINFYRLVFLSLVLALMPLNWILEVKKWQILAKSVTELSFNEALKAVLAGLSSGFVTPGRVGEFVGRIIYFPSDLRLQGTLLSFVNGFIQTLVITFFGIISAFFYSNQFKTQFDFSKILFFLLIMVSIIIIVYLLSPKVFKDLSKKKWTAKLKNTVKSFSELKIKVLTSAFFISVLRFLIFCFQYYLMLWFFKVELTPVQALIGIPTMYLIITYAPTLAASEAAVRASTAVLVLSVFSNNEIGILLTGILIWLINFILPMVAGSVFVVKKEHLNS